MRERKRIARLLLTDVTATRTTDTITAHIRLAGGQHRTLTLPVPKRAWEIRQTPAATITAVDRLLDHHTCAEIAGILSRRGLANGEGKPLTATMVQRVIRTYQLPSRRQRLPATGLSPYARWPRCSACPPPPSKTGTTPELSAGSGITTKARCSTTRPTPATRPTARRPVARHEPPDQHQHQHQHNEHPNQPEGVQYAT